MYYSIDDMNGQRITEGLPEHRAASMARDIASERRTPVLLYREDGEDDRGQIIRPRPWRGARVDTNVGAGVYTGHKMRPAPEAELRYEVVIGGRSEWEVADGIRVLDNLPCDWRTQVLDALDAQETRRISAGRAEVAALLRELGVRHGLGTGEAITIFEGGEVVHDLEVLHDGVGVIPRP